MRIFEKGDAQVLQLAWQFFVLHIAGKVKPLSLLPLLSVAAIAQGQSHVPVRINFLRDYDCISISAKCGRDPAGMYVVDSGGRDSCVDVRSASELKPLSNTIFIGSSTGDKRLPIFAAQDFSINCMGMEGENYVVKTSKPLIGVDLSTLKRIVGNGHRGVIGSDFFDAKK